MYEHLGVYKFAENRWGVVGFNYNTAKQIIADIEKSCGKEVSIRTQSKNNIYTKFTDGTVLKWIIASENARGNKIGKMWCDKNIDEDILNTIIMPMYFGKREDIIWI